MQTRCGAMRPAGGKLHEIAHALPPLTLQPRTLSTLRTIVRHQLCLLPSPYGKLPRSEGAQAGGRLRVCWRADCVLSWDGRCRRGVASAPPRCHPFSPLHCSGVPIGVQPPDAGGTSPHVAPSEPAGLHYLPACASSAPCCAAGEPRAPAHSWRLHASQAGHQNRQRAAQPSALSPTLNLHVLGCSNPSLCQRRLGA